jgi:putative membrane protein
MSKRFAVATVVLTLSTAPAFAQTSKPQQPPPTPSQSPRTQPPAETSRAKTATNSDQQFVKNVAADNMAEVELGRLAADKATRDDVKKFAQKMVDDHGKANDELKSLASSKNITLAETVPATHKATHDRLAKLSGAAFDRDYVREMVNGHRKAVAAFKAEATSGKDAEIKAWAAKMQPTIDEHFKEAEGLNRGAVGTSGQRATPPATSKPAPPDRPATPPSTKPPAGQPANPPTRP